MNLWSAMLLIAGVPGLGTCSALHRLISLQVRLDPSDALVGGPTRSATCGLRVPDCASRIIVGMPDQTSKIRDQ